MHLGTARGRRVLEPAHALAVGNISPGRCETTVGFAVAEIERLAADGRRALVGAGLQAREGMGMGMCRGRGAIVHACRCPGAADGDGWVLVQVQGGRPAGGREGGRARVPAGLPRWC